MASRLFLSLMAIGFLSLTVSPLEGGENWPQFRGPSGDGQSDEKDLPLTWGGPKHENIIWTADLLGDGIASPVVWKDRLCWSRWRRFWRKRAGLINAPRPAPWNYLTI